MQKGKSALEELQAEYRRRGFFAKVVPYAILVLVLLGIFCWRVQL